jgi:hypothetical protein
VNVFAVANETSAVHRMPLTLKPNGAGDDLSLSSAALAALIML